MTTAPTTTQKRDLRLLAGGVFLSAAGDWLALIALALAMHDITGSGLAVSAYFAASLIPVVALAGVAGVISDRFDSRRVLATASVAQALFAIALAFAASSPVAIVALSALLAAASAFAQPAEFSLVPALASGSELTRANGTMEAARYAGFAIGPLVAAATQSLGGTSTAMLIDGASFLAVAAAAVAIQPRPSAARDARGPRARARDGVLLLWRDRVLRVTLLAATGALLFISAALTVEVFYAKEVLGAGDAGYAVLTAVWMIGMVAGAAGVAPRLGRDGRHGIAGVALVALVAQGFGIGGQTAWAIVPAAAVAYVIGGIGHGVKNALLRTLIQERVREAAHGRAFAAYNAARNGAELFAIATGGVLVSLIGPRAALLIAGLGAVIAGLAGLVALRVTEGPKPAHAWAVQTEVN